MVSPKRFKKHDLCVELKRVAGHSETMWLYGLSKLDDSVKKSKQVTVYNFPPLPEARRRFDPHGDWDNKTEWTCELSADAAPPELPGFEDFEVVRASVVVAESAALREAPF